MRVPYHLHLTVPPEQLHDLRRALDIEQTPDRPQGTKVDAFVNVAEPSILDVMASCELHVTSRDEAERQIAARCTWLRAKGFTVIRQKIETVPWACDLSPAHAFEHPGDHYHETHIQTAGVFGAVLGTMRSVNATTLQSVYTMRTHYAEHGLLAHRMAVDAAISQLVRNGTAVLRVETERVVLDTTPDHDAVWESYVDPRST